jgi:hypothetical protein
MICCFGLSWIESFSYCLLDVAKHILKGPGTFCCPAISVRHVSRMLVYWDTQEQLRMQEQLSLHQQRATLQAFICTFSFSELLVCTGKCGSVVEPTYSLLLCKTQGICTLILDSVAQCMDVMINTCKLKPNFHGMWQDKKIKKLQHDLEITKLSLSKVCIPSMWNMLGW